MQQLCGWSCNLALGSHFFRSGSMAESLGVYVPAKVLGKALALGRMLMFVYLLDLLEYGLWTVGMMLAMFAAPLVGLSCHQGIIRYVSSHEAAGKIGEFYRRLRFPLL
ncbi:MAG TPA: hypothetical protein ENL37_04265, partial [Desulfobacteraceae bacterium]|nr:hypothetical protein [Desulfobacteraceae bacterium]